jgi:hypothetical protein
LFIGTSESNMLSRSNSPRTLTSWCCTTAEREADRLPSHPRKKDQSNVQFVCFGQAWKSHMGRYIG